MAELESEFIAETLSSRQLLALLFVCECQRKKMPESLEVAKNPAAWSEFKDRFGARFTNLPESERIYLVGSHLQSVEMINIYSNEEIGKLLDQNALALESLEKDLTVDGRF